MTTEWRFFPPGPDHAGYSWDRVIKKDDHNVHQTVTFSVMGEEGSEVLVAGTRVEKAVRRVGEEDEVHWLATAEDDVRYTEDGEAPIVPGTLLPLREFRCSIRSPDDANPTALVESSVDTAAVEAELERHRADLKKEIPKLARQTRKAVKCGHPIRKKKC